MTGFSPEATISIQTERRGNETQKRLSFSLVIVIQSNQIGVRRRHTFSVNVVLSMDEAGVPAVNDDGEALVLPSLKERPHMLRDPSVVG